MMPSRVDDGESPKSSQPVCALEIMHVPSGRRRYQDLALSRMVIGSGLQADIILDDSSVAPIHAELVRGPSGQWWIHDLESDSVASVRGGPSQLQGLLTTGNEIALGSFKLRLKKLDTSNQDESAVAEDVEPPRTVRFGSQLPPPPSGRPDLSFRSQVPPRPVSAADESSIGALHLSRVMSLSRNLMQTDDAAARYHMLCDFIATDDFGVESAAVVRLTGPTTARVVEGPVRRSGTILPLYLSQRMTEKFWETRSAVCYHTNSSNTPRGSSRKARVASDCPHLFGQVRDNSGEVLRPSCLCEARCDDVRYRKWPTHVVLLFPLGDYAHSIDGLHVEMDTTRGNSEWCAVVALVAEAFQQAELMWQMRSHVRQATSVERELEMARQIQQSLVPQQGHFDSLHQQLEVVVGFEPCHWVGGDYADAVPMPDGRVLLAIADVCGKGMQAALVASSLHTFVRATVDVGLSLTDMVSKINRYMCRYLAENMFITMLCIAADLNNGELEVVSAGHPPALIAEANGHVFSLDVGQNIGLGVVDTEMVSGVHRLGPDQMLFLYTDGLTESVNKQREALGTENLSNMLSSIVSFHGARGLHAMREALLNALRGYRGSLLAHDDTTFLLARLRMDSAQRVDPLTRR